MHVHVCSLSVPLDETFPHRFFHAFFVQETMVLRGGNRERIPVDCLVVGDVVIVNIGDRVPADIRVISSSGFKVTEWVCVCVCEREREREKGDVGSVLNAVLIVRTHKY